MHPPELETLPVLSISESELETVQFLEGPAIDLVDVPLDEMTEQQIQELLASIKPLTMVPGALGRNFQEESLSVAVGKARPKRAKKQTNIDDLF